MPENVDGGIIWQVFDDMNMKQKEVAKLKESLARMEEALTS